MSGWKLSTRRSAGGEDRVVVGVGQARGLQMAGIHNLPGRTARLPKEVIEATPPAAPEPMVGGSDSVEVQMAKQVKSLAARSLYLAGGFVGVEVAANIWRWSTV